MENIGPVTIDFKNHSVIFPGGITVSFDFMKIKVRPLKLRKIKMEDVPRREFHDFMRQGEEYRFFRMGFKNLNYRF